MKLRSIILMAALAAVGSVSAQDTDDTPLELPSIESIELQAPVNPLATPTAEPVDRIKFIDSPEQPSRLQSSSDRPGKMTAAELRQARALYRSEQRIRRMEMNAWMGYEPLRPNWTSIPSMTSRYPSRNTIYVPVYIYSH